MPSLALVSWGIRGTVILIGILGNILSYFVFSRTVFRKNSISVYCRALAIFDCFTISQLATDIALVFYDIYPADLSDTWCKLSFYINTAGSSIPAWILVAFAVDKTMSMRKSQRFEFMKKRSFQYGAIAVIVLFNLILYIEIPILIHRIPSPDTNALSCTTSSIAFENIISGIVLFQANLIPFGVMMASSILIIRVIGKSRRKSIVAKMAIQKRKSRDFKFAITSLTFNFVFITLRVPLVLYYILNSVGIDFGNDFFQIATLLFFMNASISFLVYFVSNSLFRRELAIMLTLRRPLHRSETNQLNSTIVITVRPMPSVEI